MPPWVHAGHPPNPVWHISTLYTVHLPPLQVNIKTQRTPPTALETNDTPMEKADPTRTSTGHSKKVCNPAPTEHHNSEMAQEDEGSTPMPAQPTVTKLNNIDPNSNLATTEDTIKTSNRRNPPWQTLETSRPIPLPTPLPTHPHYEEPSQRPHNQLQQRNNKSDLVLIDKYGKNAIKITNWVALSQITLGNTTTRPDPCETYIPKGWWRLTLTQLLQPKNWRMKKSDKYQPLYGGSHLAEPNNQYDQPYSSPRSPQPDPIPA